MVSEFHKEYTRQHYSNFLKHCTFQQREVLEHWLEDTIKNKSADEIRSEANVLLERMSNSYWATLMFPCVATSGELVQSHVRRKMSDIQDYYTSQYKNLIRNMREVGNHAELYLELEVMLNNWQQVTTAELKSNWDEIKYDMLSAEQQADKIEKAHTEALAMNREHDQRVKFYSVISKLSEEEADIIRNSIHLLGVAS